ncbi:MAG: hypothetical protein O3C51_09255 [Planctomycetota bacterium]|nr:hypothetical protein [Planctomycetota bacterium]
MSNPDPFATLGLAPTLDLDLQALEASYLAHSREAHPDRWSDAVRNADDPAILAEALALAASVNDAYRVLKDRWLRAGVLIDRLDADARDATRTLSPLFLAEAMELAESVAEADDDGAPQLRDAIADRVERTFVAVADALREGDARAAATALHQSQYFRKALADLDARCLASGGDR